MNIDVFNNFYKGKKVLVTGHTGFKGSWLSIWLHELGAEVVGVGLEPYSEKDKSLLNTSRRLFSTLQHNRWCASAMRFLLRLTRQM